MWYLVPPLSVNKSTSCSNYMNISDNRELEPFLVASSYMHIVLQQLDCFSLIDG